MPGVLPPTDQWLQNQLAQMKAGIAALKAQVTQYVVDAAGVNQAIIGDVSHDQSGNSTGYTGFGLVSFQAKNTGWTAASLINSFAAGAGSTPGYLKDALGFVHLRGSVNTGTTNTVAFVLPAGYRPGVTDFWPALQSSGVAGSYVNIATNGNVTVTYTGGALWLTGITFLAEN